METEYHVHCASLVIRMQLQPRYVAPWQSWTLETAVVILAFTAMVSIAHFAKFAIKMQRCAMRVQEGICWTLIQLFAHAMLDTVETVLCVRSAKLALFQQGVCARP